MPAPPPSCSCLWKQSLSMGPDAVKQGGMQQYDQMGAIDGISFFSFPQDSLTLGHLEKTQQPYF